jgi:hypothetical protein
MPGRESQADVSKAVFTGHKGLESRPAVISVFAKQSHNSAGGAEAPDAQRARVLLTSVFGPYARDDKFGSRAINPMELYHNQVTRARSRCECSTARGAS